MKQTYCNPIDLGYRYQHMKEGPRTAGSGRVQTPRWYPSRANITSLFPCRRASGIRTTAALGFPCRPGSADLRLCPRCAAGGRFPVLLRQPQGAQLSHPAHRRPLTEPFAEVSAPFAFWDPDLFCDDDGRVYFYWGCSNTTPIYGVEMDLDTMTPIGEKQELIFGNETVLATNAPATTALWTGKPACCTSP
mgnify:CR=1 FL=1